MVSWDAKSLIKAARGQGYRVYAEVPVGKAAEIIRSAGKNGLAGIVINSGNFKAGQIDGRPPSAATLPFPRFPCWF